MSWAGVKDNKEFTLKTSKVWELFSDVINAKFPEFQKNMAVHFNNFHKDAGKEEATRVAGRGRWAYGAGRVDGREDKPAVSDQFSEQGIEGDE